MTSARWRVAGLVLVLLLPPAAAASPVASGLTAQVLTPGPERYVVRAGAAGEVIVEALAPLDGVERDWNRREILVDQGSSPARDQLVCATWTGQSHRLDQEGLAVRFRAGPGYRRRAITLTKNTFADYDWVFNLLSWDTGRVAQPWRSLGQFDLSAVVSSDLRLLPFPWRVCLRATGRQVSFKVWLPDREPEPPWSDPVHSRSTRVSHRLDRAGLTGWYAGHLRPGDRVTYADLASAAAGAG